MSRPPTGRPAGHPGRQPGGGAASLLTRPLRIFWPLLVLGGVGFLAVTGYLVPRLGEGFEEAARGAAGTAVTIPEGASGQVNIYGTYAETDPTTEDTECELETDGSGFVALGLGSPEEVNGQTLHLLGEVTDWQAGAAVTCTGSGLDEVVLGQDAGSRAGLMVALTGFVGLGALGLGLVGFALSRSARTAGQR